MQDGPQEQGSSSSTKESRVVRAALAAGSSTTEPAASSTTASTDHEPDSDEEEEIDVTDVQNLLATGTRYLERGEFQSAHQMFQYALKRSKMEEGLEKLRVRLNICLCLQKQKRIKELVTECTLALNEDVVACKRRGGRSREEEDQLLRLEAACYTRRGWARNQLGSTVEGKADAACAQELLKLVKR